jgi:hypothetical protein
MAAVVLADKRRSFPFLERPNISHCNRTKVADINFNNTLQLTGGEVSWRVVFSEHELKQLEIML